MTVRLDASADRKSRIQLEIVNVYKTFGGIHALEDISMNVRVSEVVALVGDNGAGKSTLVKTISGIFAPDSGSIRVNGEVARIHSPHDAMSYGIQTVYQDLALCNNLDTVQNLFLGRELTHGLIGAGRLRRSEMEERARAVLNDLGVRTLLDFGVPVGSLSGGQRQSVAICRSVLWDPKVILLDEPTAALGVAQRKEVMSLIKRMRDTGRSVVVISHDLADVFDFADRVVVLRLGRKVAEFIAGTYSHDDLVAAITGLSHVREAGA